MFPGVQTSCTGSVSDIVLVVDRNQRYITRTDWGILQDFLAHFLLGPLDIGFNSNRVGLVSYDRSAEVLLSLDRTFDKDEMGNLILNLDLNDGGKG